VRITSEYFVNDLKSLSVSKPILPNSTIGVFGSGQLGRMFAIEARKMGYRVHTFSPDADTPTGHISDVETSASYDDLDVVRGFAGAVDVVTFEFENVPSGTIEAAAELVPVHPKGEILHITQNRLREKNWLEANGIPLAPFRHITSEADLPMQPAKLGCPQC
jgi:5-(carboxyamino)imidazole ribonucleotide synthase